MQANYIYIVGHGRSGTTLLESILGAHPEIVAMGEIEKLSLQLARGEKRRCSCGELPINCAVWSQVCQAIQLEFHIDMKADPFRFRVSDVGREQDEGLRAWRHWLTRYNSRLWRYATYLRAPLLRHGTVIFHSHRTWAKNRLFIGEVMRRIGKAEAVVDSSKDYLSFRDLYEASAGRMRTVFMTRDVRGNVWSYMKKGVGKTVRGGAESWVKCNRRTLKMLEAIPTSDWMHLRYEDLCKDPEGVCRQLCEFLGCDYHPDMCGLRPKDYHTIGGNKMRHEAITAVREDVKWKEGFSESDVRLIEAVAGPLATRLGYSMSGVNGN